MRLLIFGQEGQLARSLADVAADRAGLELRFLSSAALDLSEGDEGAIRRAFDAAAPELVVNAAAYTNVDGAEDNEKAAFALNARAPALIAAAVREAGARMIHISTDYIFDGSAAQPYDESAAPSPINTYGRSKLAGEEAVRAALPEHVIIRTAWVYGPFGRNFAKSMLRLARNGQVISVVDDQWGNPTSSLDLATAILHVARIWSHGSNRGLGETFHFAGTEDVSWKGFAEEVFTQSADIGGPVATVEGISSKNWPTKALRPANSRLDSSKFGRTFDYELPPWRESLRLVVRRLLGWKNAT